MNFTTFASILNQQKEFSDLFFESEDLSVKEIEEITKTFILGLHAEASDLISGTNYKDHRIERAPVDHDRILFKSIDIFRYLLALLNLWGIDSSDFAAAFEKKDAFLHMRHSLSTQIWENQDVIIFDMDDVIADFRDGFTKWLHNEKGIFTDPNSTEYYCTKELLQAGIEPETVFREFINSGGMLSLEPDKDMIEVMRHFKQAGYWIQILTARPSDNLRCFYDTFMWLKKHNIPLDDIGFSGEKYRWLADKKYYNAGKVICAIDDSPKHSSELAKHGVRVIVPTKTYNSEVSGNENITRLPSDANKYIFTINQHICEHNDI